jgi:lysine biosynthesis protein LysW
MEELEIICPSCGETNLMDPEEFKELQEGDVLECEHCGAYFEVISLDPLEVEVVEERTGFFVDCPRCETPIEVEEEGEPVTCPECGYTFTPDWSDVDEEL